MAEKLKQEAQDAIIAVCVNAAFRAEDEGRGDLAREITREAVRLAKRYGLSDVPGLPGTWQPSQNWRKGGGKA